MSLIFSSLLVLFFAFTLLICTIVFFLHKEIVSVKRHEGKHARQLIIYQKQILDILEESHPDIFMKIARRQIAND
jgi:hypothetical protein